MAVDVRRLLKQLSPLPYEEELHSIEELLLEYPCFLFDKSIKGKENIWHDRMKQASPDGMKTKRNFSEEEFHRLRGEELQLLLGVRNLMKRILKSMPASRNKKIILQMIEHNFNIKLETGGGASHRVQRIIKIYNKEGKVETRKRKPPTVKPNVRAKRGPEPGHQDRIVARRLISPINGRQFDNFLTASNTHSQASNHEYNCEQSRQSYAILSQYQEGEHNRWNNELGCDSPMW